ncbi:histone acetylase complex subunit [Aaosphaeria arxii CBS 175.79]|uniref:Chromatin modification-related protein EAF3 n=1 Tax=Aaosphaeria arxii CBS 175.79 TaxID=1450172 RepID=A0A6A5XVN8_9PLEO|nr:histone acetylase complex subunit [Aaosphaeria arxii CBS 175.79]KAF2017019.1 histone acetylase complex subunit [Aaosphaeria arxii CBS 175.79]
MAPAAAPEPQFKKDEKALCFHHELLYEAKVLDLKPDSSDKKNGYEYKVHYKGWKNTWDDWVPEDRLRKITPENRELANQLRHEMLAAQRAARAQPPPSKRKPQGSTRGSEERQTSVAATAGPRGQKRVRDHDLEKEEAFQSRRSIRIPMPDRLKSLLVDDWENITKNLQLVQLPSTKPAGVILDEYLESQNGSRRRGSAEADILEEVVQGLKEYFNKSLGRLLLYRFEREQFFDIHTRIESPTSDLSGKNLADIYGGEHLLRLFVSMPELIAQTNMDQQSVGRLREELTQILSWLAKEPQVNAYFASVYESPGQAYIDKVKSSA